MEIKDTDYTISPNQKAEVKVSIKDTKNRNGLYQVTFWVESVEYSNQGRVTQNLKVQVKEDRFSIMDIPFLMPGTVIMIVIIAIAGVFMFFRRSRRRIYKRGELTDDIEFEV